MHTKSRLFLLPWAVFLIGVLFSLGLQWLVPGEVFYSGDGGLKALQAKQFLSGPFHFDLRLSSKPWVEELWQDGLYPFGPPFVYERGAQRYIGFPFLFALLSAPLYALLGFRGFYVLPLVSSWVLWLALFRTCYQRKLGPAITAAALSTLILASPLTEYSAMYWEHTLAVSLAFLGIIAFLSWYPAGPSGASALAGGVLLGLSAWLRPEMLFLSFVVAGLVVVDPLLHLNLAHKKALMIGLLPLLVVFLGMNIVLYGHPLGMHSLQVVQDYGLANWLAGIGPILGELSKLMFFFFPAAVLVIPYGLLAWKHPLALPPLAKQLLLIVLAYALSVPLILPNGGGLQWGPRYWLILMPLLVLFLALVARSGWDACKTRGRFAILVLFQIALLAGLAVNVWQGPDALKIKYRGWSWPLAVRLRDDPRYVVAYGCQYAGQELEMLIDQKAFFYMDGYSAWERLVPALQQQHINELIYIALDEDEPPHDLDWVKEGKETQVVFSREEEFGRYVVYTVSIHGGGTYAQRRHAPVVANPAAPVAAELEGGRARRRAERFGADGPPLHGHAGRARHPSLF